MKNNIVTPIIAIDYQPDLVCNFGWNISIIDSNIYYNFNPSQLFELSPNTNNSIGALGSYSISISDHTAFERLVTFNATQTGEHEYTWSLSKNELSDFSVCKYMPLTSLYLDLPETSETDVIIDFSSPTLSSNGITSVTINTNYNSDEHYGVICKLYNKATSKLIETKSQTKNSQVTFSNLTPKTEYIVVTTYVCNTSNSNYNYDNFVEFTTLDKSTPSRPDAPIIENKTTTSVTLKATEGYEYSIDGVTWQESNVFTGLNANEEYTFYQRIAETNTSYASGSSDGTVVTTLSDIISVYIRDNGIIKSGQLFANPNNDGILKGVTDIYYKDENNNWVKI